MPTLTLAIPKDLKKQMDAIPEMNWSEVARQAITKRLEDLRTVEEIAKKSKLTMKDVREFSEKIKKGAATRTRRELAELNRRHKYTHRSNSEKF